MTPAPPRWITAALDTLAVLGLPVSLVDRVRAVVGRSIARGASVGELSIPLLERVRGLRRGYLIAGAAGIVSLVAAVALVAAGGGGGLGTGVEEVSVTEPNGGASTPSVDEGVRDDSLSTRGEASETSTSALEGLEPESLLNPSPDEWPVITKELIERWLECHAALVNTDTANSDTASTDTASTGTANTVAAAPGDCVAEIVHAGSVAAGLIGVNDARHETLRDWLEHGGESVVVERMGGAALIDLLVSSAADTADSATPAPTTAASLLVVRSEAGWRVRDVLVDD